MLVYDLIHSLEEDEKEIAWTMTLKKGDKVIVNDTEWSVIVDTNNTLRLKSKKETLSFKRYEKRFVETNYGTKPVYAYGAEGKQKKFLRECASLVDVDLVNRDNPFHKPSQITELTIKALEIYGN